jgi:hypothetical protein
MLPSFVAGVFEYRRSLLQHVAAVNQPEGWSINERYGRRVDKPLQSQRFL